MNISKLDNLVYTIVKDMHKRRRGRKIKIWHSEPLSLKNEEVIAKGLW